MMLALRPEFTAPGPKATDGATSATRREAGMLVLTAGLVTPDAVSVAGLGGVCLCPVNARGNESLLPRAFLM